MLSKMINKLMVIVGLVGMVVIALMSIIDSHATDIVSAVPVQLLFVALFLGGYLKNSKE